MPLDGTYGRLSAHKQRVQELRRKKEIREKKTNVFRYKSNSKVHFKSVDKNKEENTIKRIQQEAKQKRIKETTILIISIIAVALFAIWFVKA